MHSWKCTQVLETNLQIVAGLEEFTQYVALLSEKDFYKQAEGFSLDFDRAKDTVSITCILAETGMPAKEWESFREAIREVLMCSDLRPMAQGSCRLVIG